MFNFEPEDTRIFEYSRGEKKEDGSYKNVFADPADIKRRLDISLPNRTQLIDQHLAGEFVKRHKTAAINAFDKDPIGYLLPILIRDHGYQVEVPDPAKPELLTLIPNPESPLEYARRVGAPLPTEYTADENAAIRMGGIAHQNLCIGLRSVFDLMPFDPETGDGCTDYMAVAIMNEYHDWRKKKPGNTPPSPTSSPPTPAA